MVSTTSPASLVSVSPDALVRLTAVSKEAGRAALDYYHPGIAVRQNEDRRSVTAAEDAADAVIARALCEWDPAIPIISKAREVPGPADWKHWNRFWLVDPLDGTQDFTQRNSEFTVNIALIENGIPVLGVIHAPALQLLYYGGDGLGAWKRDADGAPERIVSRPPLPGHSVRVAESRSHPTPELEAYLATVRVAERIQAGSSLKFCWVAEGKADVYARFGPTMAWDVAAGDCIFRNSALVGRRVSPLTYNQLDLRNQGFAIGLHDATRDGSSADGHVLWFTGLSGAGKTTIARLVGDRLQEAGRAVEFLDGDAIREIFPATGFTRPERDSHIRRVGFVASRLERHGVIVVASLVSPYEESRRFVRGLCRHFVEIFVATPLEECERRDTKGLYAKARRGEIQHFTGLDDPYEPPCRPELTLDTRDVTPEQSADQVLAWLGG